MSSTNFAELLKTAQEEGYGNAILQDQAGVDLVIEKADVKNTQGTPPKEQISLFIKAVSGPQAGQGTWANQTLTTDNPGALKAFFGFFGRLGLGEAYWAQPGVTLHDAANALRGLRFTADVGHRSWGKDAANQRTDNTFSNIVLPQAGVAPQQPVQQQIPQPQPQQFVPAQQPVPVAQPQPVPVQQVPQQQPVQQFVPAPAVPQQAPQQFQPVAAPQQPQAPVPQPPPVDPQTGLPQAPPTPSY